MKHDPSFESQPARARFSAGVPEGDNRERMMCSDCGFVHYVNPLVVVGVVASWGDRILLCRRSIDPRSGYWTIPAGYLELDESAEDGACREALEEANADVEIDALLGVYSIAPISQIQLIYRARLANDAVWAGEETSELGLFLWADIPWDDLAFPSVRWALRDYREVLERQTFPPFRHAWDESLPGGR